MSKQNVKILIAEDDRSMSKALELKLKKEGFDVFAVYDGLEAVEAIKKDNFSLVLLDLIMPKLDGFGVLEEIHKNNFKVKVIVASNLSQEEDLKRAKELGAVDYLIKSDTPIQEIVNKIKALI